MGLDLDEYLSIYYKYGWMDFLKFWFIILIPFPIIYGISVRIIFWVIGGFTKNNNT